MLNMAAVLRCFRFIFALAHRKYNLNRSSLRGSTTHWDKLLLFFLCWERFAGDCRGTNPQGDILGYG